VPGNPKGNAQDEEEANAHSGDLKSFTAFRALAKLGEFPGARGASGEMAPPLASCFTAQPAKGYGLDGLRAGASFPVRVRKLIKK